VVAGKGAPPADVEKTFTGGTYSTVTTRRADYAVPVYDGTAKEPGAYWTRTLPGSSADAVKSLALDPAWGIPPFTQAQELSGGGYRLQFFSPANNPGYGKLYVQEIDSAGNVISEFKNTMGPDGLIETKWVHGGP